MYEYSTRTKWSLEMIALETLQRFSVRVIRLLRCARAARGPPQRTQRPPVRSGRGDWREDHVDAAVAPQLPV